MNRIFLQQSLRKKDHMKDEKNDKSEDEVVEEEIGPGLAASEPFPPETFLPVNLIRWEDDIILDEEQARLQVFFQFVTSMGNCCTLTGFFHRKNSDFERLGFPTTR